MEPRSVLEGPQDDDLAVTTTSGAVEAESTEGSVREKRAQEVASFLESKPFYEGGLGNLENPEPVFMSKVEILHFLKNNSYENPVRLGKSPINKDGKDYFLADPDSESYFEGFESGNISGRGPGFPRMHIVKEALESEEECNKEGKYEVKIPGFEYLKRLHEHPEEVPEELKKDINLVPLAIFHTSDGWRISYFTWDEEGKKILIRSLSLNQLPSGQEKFVQLFKKKS